MSNPDSRLLIERDYKFYNKQKTHWLRKTLQIYEDGVADNPKLQDHIDKVSQVLVLASSDSESDESDGVFKTENDRMNEEVANEVNPMLGDVETVELDSDDRYYLEECEINSLIGNIDDEVLSKTEKIFLNKEVNEWTIYRQPKFIRQEVFPTIIQASANVTRIMVVIRSHPDPFLEETIIKCLSVVFLKYFNANDDDKMDLVSDYQALLTIFATKSPPETWESAVRSLLGKMRQISVGKRAKLAMAVDDLLISLPETDLLRYILFFDLIYDFLYKEFNHPSITPDRLKENFSDRYFTEYAKNKNNTNIRDVTSEFAKHLDSAVLRMGTHIFAILHKDSVDKVPKLCCWILIAYNFLASHNVKIYSQLKDSIPKDVSLRLGSNGTLTTVNAFHPVDLMLLRVASVWHEKVGKAKSKSKAKANKQNKPKS